MIIGLTGGIASGKTFCSDFFQAKGVPLVDADVIAREIVQKGEPLLEQLKALLGKEVLLSDGQLNRAWLRRQIFADECLKKQVNDLMHPLIRERAQQQLAVAESQAAWVMYSVPLLFENALEMICHAVIVVDILPDLQISRGAMRDGVTEADIRRIMTAQLSREQRLSRANFVIDNSGSRVQTRLQCADLYRQIYQNFLTG